MGQKQSYNLSSTNRNEVAAKADLPVFESQKLQENSPVRLTTSRKSIGSKENEVSSRVETKSEKSDALTSGSEADISEAEPDYNSIHSGDEIFELKKIEPMKEIKFVAEPVVNSHNIETSTPIVLLAN
uniref:Uncharacterized protein n=1 Tax=Rhabditophanes sp. KR3021 TaxID=114890 RepID=A0AC35U494_9BILA